MKMMISVTLRKSERCSDPTSSKHSVRPLRSEQYTTHLGTRIAVNTVAALSQNNEKLKNI